MWVIIKKDKLLALHKTSLTIDWVLSIFTTQKSNIIETKNYTLITINSYSTLKMSIQNLQASLPLPSQSSFPSI